MLIHTVLATMSHGEYDIQCLFTLLTGLQLRQHKCAPLIEYNQTYGGNTLWIYMEMTHVRLEIKDEK